MYDLNRCSYFTTVGELRMLLKDIPDDAEVFVGGTDAYLHVEEDNSLITFDYDNLWEVYDEQYPLEEDAFDAFWEEQNARIMEAHKARLAAEKENKNGSDKDE